MFAGVVVGASAPDVGPASFTMAGFVPDADRGRGRDQNSDLAVIDAMAELGLDIQTSDYGQYPAGRSLYSLDTGGTWRWVRDLRPDEM